MKSAGSEPANGVRFTLQTTPAGAWDGVIHCEVLDTQRAPVLFVTGRT
jgi:hypothetical protein